MGGTGVEIYTVRVAYKDRGGILVGDYPPKVIEYLGFEADGTVPDFAEYKQWAQDHLSESISSFTKRPVHNGRNFSGISFNLRYVQGSQ